MGLQKLLTLVHSACGAYLDVERELNARGLRLFLFGSHFTFSRPLFDRAAIDFPMRQRSSLVGVGRTSMDFYRVLETADSQSMVLLSGVIRVVCMDLARGISVPLPDTTTKWRLSSALPPAARHFPRVEVPESAPVRSFSTSIKIQYDDIDFNWHTNQAAYTAFAMECAAQAVAAAYYSHIRDDIAFYPALSLTCVHLAESFAADKLDVSTWEDVTNAMLLHFLVKRQQQRICYIKIDFDERTIASKL